MLKPLSSLLSLGWLLAALGAGPSLAQAQAVAAKPATSASSVTATESDGPAWHALTARQRQNLAPLERDWPGLGARHKAKWLEVSSRFATMPADEQQRVQTRMAEWARLAPAQREQARLSFQEKKALTSEQKQQRWEAYQALPDDHRQALAAKALPAEDRKRSAAAAATPASANGATALGEAPARRPATATAAAASSRPQVKSISPSIVQAKPGATTKLITEASVPPAHQLPGQPRIAAKPGQVDTKTLLPKSGPQAAASAAVAATASSKP